MPQGWWLVPHFANGRTVATPAVSEVTGQLWYSYVLATWITLTTIIVTILCFDGSARAITVML